MYVMCSECNTMDHNPNFVSDNTSLTLFTISNILLLSGLLISLSSEQPVGEDLDDEIVAKIS